MTTGQTSRDGSCAGSFAARPVSMRFGRLGSLSAGFRLPRPYLFGASIREANQVAAVCRRGDRSENLSLGAGFRLRVGRAASHHLKTPTNPRHGGPSGRTPAGRSIRHGVWMIVSFVTAGKASFGVLTSILPPCVLLTRVLVCHYGSRVVPTAASQRPFGSGTRLIRGTDWSVCYACCCTLYPASRC